MFDLNFNTIHGDDKTGRTRFLLELSSILKSYGFKIFFLGCTSEFENAKRSGDLSSFDDFRIISTSDDFNNLKIIEVINEITDTKSYDYLIVDDIDYLSDNCINSIIKTKVKKVITCLSDNKKRLPESSTFYNITDIKDMTKINDYIKTLVRDQKINSILK